MRGERVGVKLGFELRDLRLGETRMVECGFLRGVRGDILRGVGGLGIVKLAVEVDYSAVLRVDLDFILISAGNELDIIVRCAVVNIKLSFGESDLRCVEGSSFERGGLCLLNGDEL